MYMWNWFGESVNQEHHAHVWISSIRTDIWACFFHARVWTCCHGEKIHSISSIWSQKWVGFTRTLAHRPQIHQQLQKQLPRQRRTFFQGTVGTRQIGKFWQKHRNLSYFGQSTMLTAPRTNLYLHEFTHTHIYIYVYMYVWKQIYIVWSVNSFVHIYIYTHA